MPAPGPLFKSTAAFAALAMLGSSAAGAAPASPAPQVVDPFAIVSLFGTADSAAMVCAGSSSAVAAGAATAAAAGQVPGNGCVLPMVDAPPPPVVEASPTAAVAPVVPVGGASVLPLLAGLTAIALFAGIVLKHADETGHIVLPISP